LISTQQSPVSRCTKLIPFVLSVVAGSADVTSLLGLGLLNSHITGNLVILAAHIVARGEAEPALILSVPIFILVLGLTRVLVAGLEALHVNSLRPLLLLQFVLLTASCGMCVLSSHPPNPDSLSMLLAGQLGVAAMAVQNALVQLSLPGVPTTAVMTTNITHFIMDLGQLLLKPNSEEVAGARRRAKCTWPVIVGFIIGAGFGAACFAAMGLDSMSLPAGIALLALLMSLGVNPNGRQR